MTAPGVEASGDTMQITSPDETAALIDQLRTAGITLTYDPDTRTIRTGDSVIAAVTARPLDTSLTSAIRGDCFTFRSGFRRAQQANHLAHTVIGLYEIFITTDSLITLPATRL